MSCEAGEDSGCNPVAERSSKRVPGGSGGKRFMWTRGFESMSIAKICVKMTGGGDPPEEREALAKDRVVDVKDEEVRRRQVRDLHGEVLVERGFGYSSRHEGPDRRGENASRVLRARPVHGRGDERSAAEAEVAKQLKEVLRRFITTQLVQI